MADGQERDSQCPKYGGPELDQGLTIAGKNSKRRTESQPNCHRVSFTLLTEGRAGVIVVGVGALGGANVGADLKGK